MRLFILHFKSVYLTLLGLVLLACGSIGAWANPLPEDVRLGVLEMAQRIERDKLLEPEDWIEAELAREDIEDARRLMLLRMSFMRSLFNDTGEVIAIATKYETAAKSFGTARDIAVADLFNATAGRYTQELSDADYDLLVEQLSEFADHPDWFVRHRTASILTQFDYDLSNKNAILDVTKESYQAIPDTPSAYTLEARILSLADMSYLHNFLKNPELALENTQTLIDVQTDAQIPVNGVSITNNFLYSMSAWREFQTADQLGDILLRLEQIQPNAVSGLTEMRMARINNELGQFSDGLNFAEQSMTAANMDLILNAARLNKATALAGLGRTDEAARIVQELNADTESDIGGDKHLTYAEALLALNTGNLDRALELFNQRLDIYIQELLSTTNTDTASLLASLQNSKERQAERQAALEREAALQREDLENQRRINILLRVLIGALALMVLGALWFASYRHKASQKLAAAAEKALAGEKSKTEFLAMMSHEFRTPLNGIIGFADMLSKRSESDEARKLNNVILKSGNELLWLVENILDMTQIENKDLKLYPENTQVRKLFDQAETKWRSEIESRNIKFTVHIADSVPETLVVDSKRLANCVDQLLSNSSKYTREGRIHMHVTGETEREGKTRLKVIVADTGVGISKEAQSRLFKPFVQADNSIRRQFGGAGLGLAITRSLARMMDGDLTYMSRLGKGSEFILTVSGSALEKPAAITRKKLALPSRPKPKGPSRRVLVVEDDMASQEVLRSTLEPAGFKMRFAENGEAAMTSLSRDLFDIVLMDIRMPVMDGIQTTRKIRNCGKAYADIPIIVISADVEQKTMRACRAAGVDMFLAKPISAKALFDAIKTVDLRRQALERQDPGRKSFASGADI